MPDGTRRALSLRGINNSESGILNYRSFGRAKNAWDDIGVVPVISTDRSLGRAKNARDDIWCSACHFDR